MANNNFIAANNLFGWGQSFNATGKFPMLAKRVWQTYDDMIAFVSDTSDVCPAGVILTVVNDTNADNNGAYFVASCPTLADPTIPVVVEKIGSDVPSAMEATNYSAALALISSEELPLGTLIKVTNEETVGEGETAKKYNAGFYVVNGVGENAALLYLSTSSGTDVTIDTVVTDVETLKTDVDAVESDIDELTTKVSGLETTVGDAESGLVKDVADLQTAVNALPDTFVTDVKVGETSLVADGVANLSNFVQKDGDKVLSTNDYTTAEKDKLEDIEAGAQVNYVKSVGDNLAVDAAGKLTVSIPEVEVPFQSVAEGDKVLSLSEAGVLSSTLSYARETINEVDSLVLKGIGGEVIGSVPVADFIADGMLESVAPVEGTNKFLFTFKKVDGSTEDFEVDFSKFVDVYKADGTTLELNSTTNTFSVKANVFDAYGAAAQALANAKEYVDGSVNTLNANINAKVAQSDYDVKVAEIDSSIDALQEAVADVYTKSDADSTFVKSEGYVAYSNDEKTKLAAIAEGAQVNVLEGVQVNGTDLEISDKKVNIDLSAYALSTTVDSSLDNKVDKVEGSRLMTNAEGEKLGGLVNITSIAGDLSLSEAGALSVDLSGKVDKVEGKGLSTNDFTNDLLAKLNGIAEGAQVNVVKSVDTTGALVLSEAGELSVNLGAYATTEAMNSALATKLDTSAKVNGVSFVDGEATIDGVDVALGAAITRDNEGVTENVYEATTSIQSVLANLSQRIDVLDPNVSGELGITSITAGNGIVASISGGQATISVKASEVEGNMAEVKTDGVYVQDMRSYWEAI